MKILLFCLLILCLIIHRSEAQTTRYAIVPQPVRLDEQKGNFKLPADVVISIGTDDAEVRRVAEILAGQLAAGAVHYRNSGNRNAGPFDGGFSRLSTTGK